MKDKNVLLEKSFDFAVRIIKLAKFLQIEYKEFVLSKQILRSGTSIGANVNEAQAAQSKKDFISKLAISSKQARETKYWLDLLVATDYLDCKNEFTESLLAENLELVKLLTSIVKTSMSSLEQ